MYAQTRDVTPQAESAMVDAVRSSLLPSTSMDAAEALLCAAIRGTPGIWRDLAEPAAQSRFLAAATLHRLRPLLAWRLRQSGELPSWPAPIRQALADAERAEAALEIVRRQELCRLLRAFAAADVPVLLLKGAALAYSLYPEPWLRPREDTDLLVRSADARHASDVLGSAGYRPAVMQSGALRHPPAAVRPLGSSRTSTRLRSPLEDRQPGAVCRSAVARGPSARARRRCRSDDAPAARIPRRIHALLLACWHRVSHHHDSGDLLWLYDLHLLADGLSDADAAEVLAITRRTRTGAHLRARLAPGRASDSTRDSRERSSPIEETSGDRTSRSRRRISSRTPEEWTCWWRICGRFPIGGRERGSFANTCFHPPSTCWARSAAGRRRATLPALYLWRIARGAGAGFGRLTRSRGARGREPRWQPRNRRCVA